MSSAPASVSLSHRGRLGAAWRAAASEMARSRANLLALLLAALLPAGVRLAILAEGGYALTGADWWGVWSDIGTGLAAVAALVLVHRASRIAAYVAAALWLGLNAGFYEFFREYESPYFLIHAHYALDPSFIRGSGIHLSHPVVAAAMAVAFVAALSAAARKRSAIPNWLLGVVIVAGAALAALQPWSQFASPWRQRDFVSLNVTDLASRLIWPDTLGPDFVKGAALAAAYMKPDLQGTRLLPAPARPRNVVMVFIEGVSGGFLPSLAAAEHVDSQDNMPELDGWARDNLSFSSFITHQKQSNRGLYAALCGDLPRLTAGLAEMTEIADSAALSRKCLPQMLAERGYDTLFMHTADGGFMQMDRFMRRIGFQHYLASENFDAAIPRGPWGFDDAELYDLALKQIDTLAARDKPFLAAFFTSSTHHPFQIPDSYKANPELEPHQRAVAFADHAVAAFLAALKARGRLDDTLVLVTSDEASQVHHRTNLDMNGKLIGLTENWGYMVAITPERLKTRVDAPFQQADIPLSILDYLGFAEQGPQLTGRSFFRTYETPRSIFTANIYKRRIAEYAEGRSLTICDESLADCVDYDASRGPLFSPAVAPIPGDASPSPLLRAIRAYSSGLPTTAPRSAR